MLDETQHCWRPASTSAGHALTGPSPHCVAEPKPILKPELITEAKTEVGESLSDALGMYVQQG